MILIEFQTNKISSREINRREDIIQKVAIYARVQRACEDLNSHSK